MDLFSGLPYWIAKNALDDYRNPLREDIKADVVIIGSGITGALVADELMSAGIECVVIEKRGLSSGSTVASTALLQYENDTPLCELADMMGEEKAVEAYRHSLQAVADIGSLIKKRNLDAPFTEVPSVFYASDGKGERMIEKEFTMRAKHGLPVDYLNREQLEREYGLSAPCALSNNVSAQIDPYATATELFERNIRKNVLRVYTHTEVTKITGKKRGCTLKTSEGHTVTCSSVVIAAGFEAGRFMRKKPMKLTSTYAIISEPVDANQTWKHNALIWESAQPYLYIRTDNSRILVGGEDEPFNDPVKRDRLLRKKAGILEAKFRKLFPHIPFKTDMTWCGTFSSTSDGLPLIGEIPGKENIYLALGYGGNGITFSIIAAQYLRNRLLGKPDNRDELFGLKRF